MPPKKKQSGPPNTAHIVGQTVQLSRHTAITIGALIGKGAFGAVHRGERAHFLSARQWVLIVSFDGSHTCQPLPALDSRSS
jgi:hypothetical protein